MKKQFVVMYIAADGARRYEIQGALSAQGAAEAIYQWKRLHDLSFKPSQIRSVQEVIPEELPFKM